MYTLSKIRGTLCPALHAMAAAAANRTRQSLRGSVRRDPGFDMAPPFLPGAGGPGETQGRE